MTKLSNCRSPLLPQGRPQHGQTAWTLKVNPSRFRRLHIRLKRLMSSRQTMRSRHSQGQPCLHPVMTSRPLTAVWTWVLLKIIRSSDSVHIMSSRHSMAGKLNLQSTLTSLITRSKYQTQSKASQVYSVVCSFCTIFLPSGLSVPGSCPSFPCNQYLAQAS